MAAFLGMKPNTLAQSLKRFRARLGEEMRVIWDIERTTDNDEDEERSAPTTTPPPSGAIPPTTPTRTPPARCWRRTPAWTAPWPPACGRSGATHAQVERRLVTAGHLDDDDTPRPPGERDEVPDTVDAWRDLTGMLDGDVDVLEHIDALHERRLRSASPAQAARRDPGPRRGAAPHRRRLRRRDRAAAPPGDGHPSRRRVAGPHAGWAAVGGRRPQGSVTWWTRNGRWTRLGLALGAALLLGAQATVAAAVVVAVRSVLSVSAVRPGSARGPARSGPRLRPGVGRVGVHAPRRRRHRGRVGPRPRARRASGVGGRHGVRRTVLAGGVDAPGGERPPRVPAAAAVDRPYGHHRGAHGGRRRRSARRSGRTLPRGRCPTAVVAVAAVVAVGVVEIGRTVYYAFRRRRLFRQVAAAESGAAPDVLVARTGDALVMNISRLDAHRRVLDHQPGVHREPRLRVVADEPGPGGPSVVRPARPGRASRRK